MRRSGLLRSGLWSVAAVLAVALAGCSGPGDPGADHRGPGQSAAGANGASPSGTSSAAPSPGGSTGASGGPGASPGAPAGPPKPLAQPPGVCPIFPADNIWHADVSGLPVRSDSAALVASIGTTRGVHADFGAGTYDGGPIGIPVTTVPPGQAGVKVIFQYASESDQVAYPIPAGAQVEGGPNSDGDRHIILYDQAACRAYELYAAYPSGNGGWRAGSGAVFDLRGNALRARGATSADAAGLSILAGLVRYDEVAAGRIDHAIRVTAPNTRNSYVWPARHAASDSGNAALPPMGQRFRLKSSVDISRLPAQARVVAEAMKRYGLVLADNGSPWYISGAPDNRFSNDALHALGGLTGVDFEAVDASALMLTPDSATCRTP